MQVDTATASLASAEALARTANEALASGRADLNRADQMLRDALRAADEAALALDRLKGRHDELQVRLAEATTDHRSAQDEFEAAQTASANLPDGSETANLVTTLQQSSEKARLAVSQLQAEQAMTDRALGADRDRLTAAQSEIKSWRARAGEASRRMEDMGRRAADIAEQREALDGKPEAVARAIAALDESSHALLETAEACQAAERAAEDILRQAETRHAQTGEALAAAREARAGAIARAENQEQRRIEMGRISGERFECPAPVLPEKLGFDSADVRDAAQESETLEKLTQDRERIGPVNLVAAQELAELEESQTKSRTESDELTQAIHRLRGSIGSLNREGRARLLTAFEAVDGHFQRLFTALFNGGQAHLKLIDSDDPLEAGLEIMAQPPGKKLSTLTLLSGGEQALTAIALIFGLFLTNPAPICVLDEVDAPLDDANVERFCDLLDKMVQDTRTRYLIVTHNAVTMSRMHRLFGVTMIEKGVSRLVSVDLGGAEELLAAE
jgi:chromosome segregation protein